MGEARSRSLGAVWPPCMDLPVEPTTHPTPVPTSDTPGPERWQRRKHIWWRGDPKERRRQRESERQET